jgi:hypothetical protein
VRTLEWLGLALALVPLLTACRAAERTGGDTITAPTGYRSVSPPTELPPEIQEVLSGGRIQPLDTAMTVFAHTTRPSAAITLTVATYPDPAGAHVAYNRWFAAIGFAPAAERAPLALGDAAERYYIGWPPLHALVARAGPRFVLVEASDAVPAEERGAVLEDVARDIVGAGTASRP